MWDTTDVDRSVQRTIEIQRKVQCIPHLAKNERDVGHPALVSEPDGFLLAQRPIEVGNNRRNNCADGFLSRIVALTLLTPGRS